MKRITVTLKQNASRADMQSIIDSKLINDVHVMDQFNVLFGNIESEDVKDQIRKFASVEAIEDEVQYKIC